MIAKRDVAYERHVMTMLREHYSGVRPGIHQSDLTRCLRISYWDRLDPIPPSDTTLLLFFLGAMHHEMLQGIMRLPSEVKLEHEGIRMSVDILDNKDPLAFLPRPGAPDRVPMGVPVEAKTTRSTVRRFDENGLLASAPQYAIQDGNYILATDAPYGRVLIIFMVGRWNPPWPELRCYTVEFESEEERAAFALDLTSRRDALVACLEHKVVPPGPRWDFECRFPCKYAQRCVERGLISPEMALPLSEVPA